MAAADLRSWAFSTAVELQRAVELGDLDEARGQMGVLNDLLTQLSHRVTTDPL